MWATQHTALPMVSRYSTHLQIAVTHKKKRANEMSQQRLLADKHDFKQRSSTMWFGEKDVNIAFVLLENSRGHL